jgi:hypothetical protein
VHPLAGMLEFADHRFQLRMHLRLLSSSPSAERHALL